VPDPSRSMRGTAERGGSVVDSGRGRRKVLVNAAVGIGLAVTSGIVRAAPHGKPAERDDILEPDVLAGWFGWFSPTRGPSFDPFEL
jgi:hypothetical protein